VVEPGEAVVDAPRQWKQFAARRRRTNRPARVRSRRPVPIDRLRIGLPQPNTVASLEFLSRSKPADPWGRVTTATVYRLIRDGDELTSAGIGVAATPTGTGW